YSLEFLPIYEEILLRITMPPTPHLKTTTTYKNALAAIKNEEYERAYNMLDETKERSEVVRDNVVFLKTAIAAAYCIGNLQANESFRKGLKEGSKEEIVKASVQNVARAVEWGKKLSSDAKRVLEFVGKKQIYLNQELPDPVSDLCFKGVKIGRIIESGQTPSSEDRKLFETFMVGIMLRNILLKSVNPKVSDFVDAAAVFECQGTVKWVPEPLLSIGEALEQIGSRNVKALKHLKKTFGATKDEISQMLNVSQQTLLTAKKLDKKGEYRKHINKVLANVEGDFSQLNEMFEESEVPEIPNIPEDINMIMSETKDLYSNKRYEACIAKVNIAIPKLENLVKTQTKNPDAHFELSIAYWMKLTAASEMLPDNSAETLAGKVCRKALIEAIQKNYPERIHKELELFLKYAEPNHPKREAAREILKLLEKMQKN
ncbi:MAG: hypothetical protein QME81_18645, partial [bacterium]|nr:hypothetical protein [bacterium]